MNALTLKLYTVVCTNKKNEEGKKKKLEKKNSLSSIEKLFTKHILYFTHTTMKLNMCFGYMVNVVTKRLTLNPSRSKEHKSGLSTMFLSFCL